MNLLNSKFSEINQFLAIPSDDQDIKRALDSFSYSEAEKSIILDKIQQFINYFLLFKEIKPFMKSLHVCIRKTLEIQLELIDQVENLLLSNALLRFLSEYLQYSKMNQNDSVLTYLSESLEMLQTQPLIINLGLMLKPMYNDQEYMNGLTIIEEESIIYAKNDQNDLKVKRQIDAWLESHILDLNRQDEIRNNLILEFDKINMTDQRQISRDSEDYKHLLSEVLEMLDLKFTVLSLMESIPEDSFEPLPIK